MSGYIKYFQNGGTNMSFMIEDDSVLVKYNDILNKIEKILNIKFHNIPVYDEKYIKDKEKNLMVQLIQTFGVIKYQKKESITLI